MKFKILILLLLFSATASYSQAYTFDTPNSIENNQNSPLISKPFPNPVKVSAQVNYNLPYNVYKGVVVIFNILGNEVKRINVDKTQQFITLKASDYKNGTYFYQLLYNGTYSKTMRLIISN